MNLFLDAPLETKQALIDSMGVAACLVEPDGTGFVVIAMNNLCREFHGFDGSVRTLRLDAQSVSKASGLAEQLVEVIVQRTIGNYERCVQTQGPVNQENAIRLADGTVRWSRNSIAPILRDGVVVCLLVAMIDVTDTFEAQRELEQNLVKLIGQHVCVCEGCKRVQGDEGWIRLEQFMSERGDLSFSHGMCPVCAEGFA